MAVDDDSPLVRPEDEPGLSRECENGYHGYFCSDKLGCDCPCHD